MKKGSKEVYQPAALGNDGVFRLDPCRFGAGREYD